MSHNHNPTISFDSWNILIIINPYHETIDKLISQAGIRKDSTSTTRWLVSAVSAYEVSMTISQDSQMLVLL